MPHGGRSRARARRRSPPSLDQRHRKGWRRGAAPRLRAFFTTRGGEGARAWAWPRQEIIKRYGGAVSLQSQESVGTTFTLSFPAISAEPRPGPRSSVDRAAPRASRSRTRPRSSTSCARCSRMAATPSSPPRPARGARSLRRDSVDVVITTSACRHDRARAGRRAQAPARRPIVLLTEADEIDATRAQRRRRDREAAHARAPPRALARAVRSASGLVVRGGGERVTGPAGHARRRLVLRLRPPVTRYEGRTSTLRRSRTTSPRQRTVRTMTAASRRR